MMQDRFKFRFWDKETQTMQKFPMIELRQRMTLDAIFDDDRVIFMQCTGLKDKNGKLIYEGDIVKDLTYLHKVKYVCVSLPIFGGLGLISRQDLKDYKFCKENWEDYEINDNVRRFDNRFKLANQGNKLHCFNMLEDRISDYEIIGNIYENLELLKNDK